jgi:integrase
MAPRIVGRLKARQVLNATPAKGRPAALLCDGGGLYLQITRSETDPRHVRRSWVFRYQCISERHELGLGALSTVSLAEARTEARKLRQQLLARVDPLVERCKARQALIAERARTITFEEVAAAYIKVHEAGWKNERHRAQWRDTLRQYALPTLGKLAPKDIDQPLIFRIIEPLWREKTVTAGRLLERITKILDFATTNGFRTGDNPARFVRTSLPKPSTIAKKVHHAALPYADIPLFMQELRGIESTAARALEMLVLCASRTREIIVGARWDGINFKTKTWEIPAEYMKANRPHRVPLSDRVLEILRDLPRQGERVFPVETRQLARLLGTLRPPAIATVHGMRASFRQWCAERTAFPRAAIELSLAHSVALDVTEAAYLRDADMLEPRRKLMQQWSDYCATPPVSMSAADNVVAIGGG